MKIRLSPEIIEKIPGIHVSVMVFKGIRNTKKVSNVTQLLRGLVAGKKREMKDEEKKKNIQNLLKTGSIDNKTFREVQLLKSNLSKITLGREMESDNSLLDLVHYLGLKYLVPLHGCDLDLAEKDFTIELFVPRQGKKAEDLEITRETDKLVIWFIDIGTQPKEEFEKLREECAKVILKYVGGAKEADYTLNVDTPEADLNYISQKEIEYKEEQTRLAVEEARLAEEKALAEKILQSDTPPFLAGSAESGVSLLAAPPETPLRDRLAAIIKEAVEKYLAANNLNAGDVQLDAEVETPHDPTHGDYASSIAMKLTKVAGRPPREIADEIIKLLPATDYIEKTEIAGPGFINFHLSLPHLVRELEQINALKSDYGKVAMGRDKKVVIEYSQPNIAKPLGVHHLLSTIIGQILVNLHRFAGYKVTAINYPGDWGTQFGKLLYAYKNWGNEETVKKDALNELLKLYVRFHSEAEKDPALDDKGREEFKKLEDGDPENKKLWEWFKQISLDEIERIYKILDVKFDEYLGEAMYLEQAKQIIEEGLQKGIIEVGEKGALIVNFEGEKYSPFMVRKSDGATLYSTRDLASIRDRITRYDNPDKIVYVVDVAQSLHFKQLFETAHKFGFVGGNASDPADKATELVHVVFGRMQLPEGSMSTRKGEVVLLNVVIKEAVTRAEKLLAEKSPELTAEEKAKLAEAMAVSAIKYNIVSQNRETNMTFDMDRMLSLDGNSGPYLEYAYARAQSILRKNREQEGAGASAGQKTAQKDGAAKPARPAVLSKNKNQIDLFSLTENIAAMVDEPEEPAVKKAEEPGATPFGHEAEKRLLRMLPRFPEFIEASVRDYKPNHLSTYLFDLARAWNSFYNEVPVLNAARADLKASRIKLVRAVATVLQNGLQVLGIAVFEKM